MPEPPRRVAIGKLGRPHGVRGEVRLFLFNPHSRALQEGQQVHLTGDRHRPHVVEVERVRYANKFAIVKFADIDDRDAVDRFKHRHLEMDYGDLPPLEDDEFYYVELEGVPVYVATEEDGGMPEGADPIGKVDRFFATGANDVMVVSLDGGEELLVPVVEHAVHVLDLERRLVVLQPLEIWTPADE